MVGETSAVGGWISFGEESMMSSRLKFREHVRGCYLDDRCVQTMWLCVGLGQQQAWRVSLHIATWDSSELTYFFNFIEWLQNIQQQVPQDFILSVKILCIKMLHFETKTLWKVYKCIVEIQSIWIICSLLKNKIWPNSVLDRSEI